MDVSCERSRACRLLVGISPLGSSIPSQTPPRARAHRFLDCFFPNSVETSACSRWEKDGIYFSGSLVGKEREADETPRKTDRLWTDVCQLRLEVEERENNAAAAVATSFGSRAGSKPGNHSCARAAKGPGFLNWQRSDLPPSLKTKSYFA